MKRQDLLKVFPYVYSECPYIKVNVRLKATSNAGDGLKEDPDDIIESISQPYLAWSTMD